MKKLLYIHLEQKLGGWEPDVPVIYPHNHDFLDIDVIEGFHNDFVHGQKSNVIQSAILACDSIAKYGDLHILSRLEGLYLLHHAISEYHVYKTVRDGAKPRAIGYYGHDFWSHEQAIAWVICVVWDWYDPPFGSMRGKRKWIEQASKRFYEEQPPSRFDEDGYDDF